MARRRIFTPEQVREFRRIAKLRQSLPSIREMARKAGVDDAHLCQIISGKLYKDVR